MQWGDAMLGWGPPGLYFIPDPPLTVKGRKVGGGGGGGGSGIICLTIDLGEAESAADLGAFFKHHVGPPPPPPPLKVEWSGGSRISCGPSDYAQMG
jgi:hypothetical protein